ncbi:MAG: signal peptidase I [Armatimonadetes bacterium]|nr:signal peptidase I [Armatimonadota bacterium]
MSPDPVGQKPGKRRILMTGFGVFLLGVFGFVLFFYVNFKTVEVKGESMEPTFESGRRLLMSNAYWLVGPIRIDDIVVIKVEDGETFIKRVKGLPGDVIDFMNTPTSWKLGRGEYKVPQGTVYVLGDNRPVSQDSRDLGPIDRSDILGKVVIYGRESWLYTILSLSVLGVLASAVASFVGNSGRPKDSA